MTEEESARYEEDALLSWPAAFLGIDRETILDLSESFKAAKAQGCGAMLKPESGVLEPGDLGDFGERKPKARRNCSDPGRREGSYNCVLGLNCGEPRDKLNTRGKEKGSVRTAQACGEEYRPLLSVFLSSSIQVPPSLSRSNVLSV